VISKEIKEVKREVRTENEGRIKIRREEISNLRA